MITSHSPYSDYFYLCIKPYQRGTRSLKFRIQACSPRLEPGEITIRVNVAIPRILFQRPSLSAAIAIPESACSPPVIEANVIQNLEEAIRQNLGIDLKLTLGESPK